MTQVIVTIQRNIAIHPLSVTIVTKPGTASKLTVIQSFKHMHFLQVILTFNLYTMW